MNEKALEKNEKMQLHDFYIKKEEIWFAIDGYNKLFNYNMHTNKIHSVEKFIDEKVNGLNQFIVIEEYNKKIFFIPFFAKNLFIYDFEKNNLEIIRLNFDKEVACKYCCCYKYKNFLRLLPICCENILQINMDNYEQKYILNKEISMLKGTERNIAFFCDNIYEFDKKFFVHFSESNKIIIFDKMENRLKVKKIEMDHPILSTCGNDGILFCLERNTGRIISWDIKAQKVFSTDIDYSNISRESFNEIINVRSNEMIHTVFRENSIYMCPGLGNCCIKINLSKNKAYTIIENRNRNNLKRNENLNSKIHTLDKKLIFFFGIESTFIIIDENDSLEKHKILLDKNHLMTKREELLSENLLEEDDKMCNLELFVEKNICKQNLKDVKLSGHEILKAIERTHRCHA